MPTHPGPRRERCSALLLDLLLAIVALYVLVDLLEEGAPWVHYIEKSPRVILQDDTHKSRRVTSDLTPR